MTTFFPSHTRNHPKKFTSNGDDSAFNSQVLYDQVLRKNHEMMKGLLTKMTEIYNRQEQYEQTIGNLNGQLEELEKDNQNLHHQMRVNHLQIERQQQILINDIKGVKNILKIPDPTRSYEDYLTSGFFKEQSSLINVRSRRGRTADKSNRYIEKTVQIIQDQNQNQERRHATVEQPRCQFSEANIENHLSIKEEHENAGISMKVVSIPEQQPKNVRDSILSVESVVQQRLKGLSQQLQTGLKDIRKQLTAQQLETETKIEELRQEFENKIQSAFKEMKKQNEWHSIDFLQLQKYLDSKVKEHLSEQVSKNYFQESLSNLQQAWQKQLDELDAIVQNKITAGDLVPLEEKINDLASQQDSWHHLNSIKIQNISYNSTCKSTPYRVNQERTSVADQESNCRLTRQSDENRAPKKNQLRYCNSHSTMPRNQQIYFRKMSPRMASGDVSTVIEEISEQKWKERVTEKLGLSKVKRPRQ